MKSETVTHFSVLIEIFSRNIKINRWKFLRLNIYDVLLAFISFDYSLAQEDPGCHSTDKVLLNEQ